MSWPRSCIDSRSNSAAWRLERCACSRAALSCACSTPSGSRTVRERDWVRAVEFDLQFHALLIRFHHNRRLESFYQKVIGELRMGMVLVDRGHDDPGRLVPVHRKLYQLLENAKLRQCAALLTQHLQDSESRLSRIMNGQRDGQGT